MLAACAAEESVPVLDTPQKAIEHSLDMRNRLWRVMVRRRCLGQWSELTLMNAGADVQSWFDPEAVSLGERIEIARSKIQDLP